MSSSKHKVKLHIKTDDQSIRIRIFDGALHEIPLQANLGEVEIDLNPGVYAIDFQRGREITRKTVVLSAKRALHSVSLSDDEAPQFATAAPVENTFTSRETHQQAAQRISQCKPIQLSQDTDTGHLFIFARELDTDLNSDPAAGLTVHDVMGKRLIDIQARGQKSFSEGWCGIHLALPPGAYRLRNARAPDFLEQMIYVQAGWQTQVFLLITAHENLPTGRVSDAMRISILMVREGEGFMSHRHDISWTESALRALDVGGNVPGSDSNAMLRGKFENPMLGIYAGLLHLRREEINHRLMKEVFDNLYHMVGSLPDVLALGWALTMRDPTVHKDKIFMERIQMPSALANPPMLRESWTHITLATATNFSLVPADSLTARVAVNLTTARPWLAWQGEPPKLEKPSINEVRNKRGLISNLVDAVKEFLAEPTLDFLLPRLNRALNDIPDVGYRLYAPEFNHSEKAIARYLNPLVDPVVAQMIKESKGIRGSFASQAKGKARGTGNSWEALIRAMGVPASTVMGSTWGLYKKLVFEAMPPLKFHLKEFARIECQESEELKELIMDLTNETTMIVHQHSRNALNMLQLLYLRYLGRPGFRSASSVTMKKVIQWLTDADYRLENGHPVTQKAIKDNLSQIEKQLTSRIDGANFPGKILADNWQEDIFCRQEDYKRGGLLGNVFVEQSEPEALQEWSELQLVTGIGPKTEAFLQAQGIESLEQIAALDKNVIKQLGTQMAGFEARLDRYDWPAQAKSYLETHE